MNGEWVKRDLAIFTAEVAALSRLSAVKTWPALPARAAWLCPEPFDPKANPKPCSR
ncbi:MAG: hypothetical protein WB611_16030 [Stellaceae bacterium]